MSLTGTNLYDASEQAGATAWDAAALNPSLSLGVASTATATLPCYASAQQYLGGDSAFNATSWGSGKGAGAPNSVIPPGIPAACYSASGDGAFWQVRCCTASRRAVHAVLTACCDWLAVGELGFSGGCRVLAGSAALAACLAGITPAVPACLLLG